LFSVNFKVNINGIHRIRKNKRKEVAAVCEGIYQGCHEVDLTGYREATIDPYKNESFVYVDTGEPIYKALNAVCYGKRVWVK
jgi:hypothetical protein